MPLTPSLRCALLALSLLLGVPLAAAQDLPAIGTDGTLDIATWNIEWFGAPSNGPSDPDDATADTRQIGNARAVIEQSAIDLWAVQEIADPDDFAALLDALGDAFGGVLATESTSQRIGFIYRRAVLNVRSVSHILEDFEYPFASRPPLQLEADVTLPDTTVILTFIALHAKCCGSNSDYERREEAATRLKNRIDFSTLARAPVIVLGDFNDELNRSIAGTPSSPYANFIQDAVHYRFITADLDADNEPTYCRNGACTSGSTLDHILITDELFDAYLDGSAARYTSVLDAIDSYVYTTSDHLPVYARFAFGPYATAASQESSLPTVVQPPAPNPFRTTTTLRYTLPQAAPVRINVFDVLGRRVATLLDAVQPPGSHQTVFEADALPAGLYFVHLQTSTERWTFSLMRIGK